MEFTNEFLLIRNQGLTMRNRVLIHPSSYFEASGQRETFTFSIAAGYKFIADVPRYMPGGVGA